MKKLDKRDYMTKSIEQQHLPSRHTLNSITKADPLHRTLGNYSKLTPSINQTGPNIFGVDENS
jgi:hypothetical protein